jgi:hypothetical protein
MGKNEADDSPGNLVSLKKAFERLLETSTQIKEKYELAQYLEEASKEP